MKVDFSRGWLTRSALVALLALGACNQAEHGVPPPATVLQLSATSLEFDTLIPGGSTSKVLRVTNAGENPAHVSLATPATDGPFSLSPDGMILQPRESAEVVVRFAPLTVGEFSDGIGVSAGEWHGAVALSGSARDAQCAVDAAPIDLGAVMVGGSRSHALRLINDGPMPFDFTADLVSGDGEGLSLEPLETTTLPVAASTTLRVQFRPEKTGDASAVLRIRAPSCERNIPVTATAVNAAVVGTSSDFGFVHLGAQITRGIVIQNLGREPVNVAGLSIIGSAEFELGQATTAFVLAGESTVEVPVTFKPESTGTKAGGLVAQLDHPVQRQLEVELRGWGGGANLEVPKKADFGTVAVGSWAIQRITVRNTGSNVPGTTLDNLVLGGQGRAVAEIQNDPSGAFELIEPDAFLSTDGLAAGEAGVLRVRFKPLGPGLHSAALRVHSNDPAKPSVAVELVAQAEVLPDCSWSLSTTALEFGDVSPTSTATRTLQLRNSGTTACHVGVPQLFGASAFSLAGAPAAATVLAPGTALELSVRYLPPSAGNHSATLVLYTSSSTAPEVVVPLTGRGSSTCLQVLPVIDLGVATLGCSAKRAVDLYNVCSASIQFTSSDVAGAGFSVSTATLPATIATGGALRLNVEYQPTFAGTAFGALRLVTLDGRTVVTELRGTGAADANRRDTFTVPSNKVDVLIVGDDGSGVPNNLTIPIAAQAELLFGPARAAGVDFHVAVTTTSADAASACCSYGAQGRFLPALRPAERVITPTTPDLEQVFARNMDIGIGGSATEQPLEAFRLALSPENLAGHNKGFLRPDARLHVVLMTNAADQSPHPVDYYEEFAAQLVATGQTKGITISGIVPTMTSAPGGGCSYDDSSAGRSPRNRDLITMTGGFVKEYCEAVGDIPAATAALSEKLFGSNLVFPLRSAVDGSQPILVKVNGQVLPALDVSGEPNWTVDATARTLRLAPIHAPGAGDTLEIEYLGMCQP